MVTCACKTCKKMFNSMMTMDYCPECAKGQRDYFEEVVKYLDAFPNSNAMQISEAMDIPINVLIDFIDQGRLYMVKGSFEKM